MWLRVLAGSGRKTDCHSVDDYLDEEKEGRGRGGGVVNSCVLGLSVPDDIIKHTHMVFGASGDASESYGGSNSLYYSYWVSVETAHRVRLRRDISAITSAGGAFGEFYMNCEV